MKLTNTPMMTSGITATRTTDDTDSIHNRLTRLFGVFLLSLLLSCAPGGGDTADTGGMSGTGISQGAVTAFGSIYVNGIQWDVSNATVEFDGEVVSDTDLRLGMVVRVESDFQVTGTTGIARSVFFDDSLEGPINTDPVDIVPGGLQKTFDVLGTTVVIHEIDTVYDGDAGFATLVADDVVEISGFVGDNGTIQATRVDLKGQFPANSDAELRDVVSNLIKNLDGTGSFNLRSVLVSYTTATAFEDVTLANLSNEDFIEAKGILRSTGSHLDATKIELEEQGLGDGNADEAEIEGVVSRLVSDTSFSVGGTKVDATNADFEPLGFIVMNGSPVEVEGRLVEGVLVANQVKSEADDENVRIEAAVVSIDSDARTLSILGLTVSADGQTQIQDSQDEDGNFRFDEIQPGDWLQIRGRQTGSAAVLATLIERDNNEDTDVLLEGPVTALEIGILTTTMSILDQAVPLDAETLYFDSMSTSRTEEEFFRTPGYVMLGDLVQATDFSATDPRVLGEADEIEIEND